MAHEDLVMSVQEEVDDARQVEDGPTASGTECSSFLSAKQVWSGGTQDPSGGALVSSDPVASSSEYYSTRIATMMEREGESSVEGDIEDSRVHWSELQAECGAERGSLEANRAVFEKLKQQYGGFFVDWDEERYEIGEKIAEGAQGAIHKGLVRSDLRFLSPLHNGLMEDLFVFKVFKMEGVSLEDLQKQWPASMLLKASESELSSYWNSTFSGVSMASMLKDGSFVFVIPRYWGDLRKLIDIRMVHNKNQAPPFSNQVGLNIMRQSADGMQALHEDNIVHRDLKASNVLVGASQLRRSLAVYNNLPQSEYDPLKLEMYNDRFIVADFECSGGVVGTGFWRAPEILRALKNRNCEESMFTGKSDVYSYAMTCYEVLTGKIPFEDKKPSDYDVVLGGERPDLPKGTEPWVQSLLSNCWDEDPCKRPSFQEIVRTFKREMSTEELENRQEKIVKSLGALIGGICNGFSALPFEDLEVATNDRFYPKGLGFDTSDPFRKFRNRKVRSVAKSFKNC